MKRAVGLSFIWLVVVLGIGIVWIPGYEPGILSGRILPCGSPLGMASPCILRFHAVQGAAWWWPWLPAIAGPIALIGWALIRQRLVRRPTDRPSRGDPITGPEDDGAVGRRPWLEYGLVVVPVALAVIPYLMAPTSFGGDSAPYLTAAGAAFVALVVVLVIASLLVTHRTRDGSGLAAGLGLSILATVTLLFLPALVLMAGNVLAT